MRYAILIEKGKRNYSAYAPDPPGCVATGRTLQEVKKQMKEALEFHFEGMMLDGEPIPKAATQCDSLEINMARIEKTVQRESLACRG
jgi:predicted RNase H-like HicB family nuclease